MDFKIFKAYDVRGKHPSELNEETVFRIAEAIGKYFFLKAKSSRQERGSSKTAKLKAIIVIGRDARLSSPSLYKAVLNGLKAKSLKLKAIPVGIVTTPMFYFLVNKLKADGGIMVTASHNPKEYNGLKIVGKKAAPMSGKEILKIINRK